MMIFREPNFDFRRFSVALLCLKAMDYDFVIVTTPAEYPSGFQSEAVQRRVGITSFQKYQSQTQ